MGVKLGKYNFKHGLMLAPMAGFSDRAMRKVCYEYGAELSVTEMISAKAVVFGDRKTEALAAIREDEGPVILQIFGSEPDIMAKASELLSKGKEGEDCASPIAIDINMGCPVNKIYNNSEGSALMKRPELIYSIVKATNQATDLPVTVKMRLGLDKNSINATECALAAEEAGAALICLHGRTRVEMYSGEAHLDEIAKVKKHLQIPLIANGDVADGASALRALALTGADGIAIGRGAVGNPFVFSEVVSALEGQTYTSPSFSHRINTAIYQLSLAVEDKGERVAVRESRGQIAQYIRAFSGAAAIRNSINRAESFEEVKEILLSSLK